jgi:hypothetical protein
MVVGQVDNTQTSRKDFIAYCQAMQGRWVNDSETLQDVLPGFSEKGKSVMSYAEIKIIADGNALEEVWYAGKGMSKQLGDTMTAVGTKPGVKTPTFEGKFTRVKQVK